MDSTDAVIRLLAADDLDEAFGLSTAAGWNQRLADWRMLLQLAPAGSFAAVASGRIIGTAIGIDYGAFGWIAMMLVDPGWRGRGVGARLLESAMGAVPPETPIRLDATPLGRPLYQRYGFEEEARLTRHVAEPPSSHVDLDSRPRVASCSWSHRRRSAGRDHTRRSDLRRPSAHPPRVGARGRRAVRPCDRDWRATCIIVSDGLGACSTRSVRWWRQTMTPRARS